MKDLIVNLNQSCELFFISFISFISYILIIVILKLFSIFIEIYFI